jgi:SAM-dependent methyltransferase
VSSGRQVRRLHSIARAFWSASSRTWDDALADPSIAGHVDDLAGWLAAAVRPEGWIADLGCGTGNHRAALAGRGLQVVGVDGSPGMLHRAATKQRGGLVQADLSVTLPFTDGALDGAISVFAAQFLDLSPFVAEIRRVVRPGGAVLVEIPQVTARRSVRSLSWRYRAFRVVKNAVAAVGLRTGVIRRHSAEDLRNALERAGLEELDTKTTGNSFAVLARVAAA